MLILYIVTMPLHAIKHEFSDLHGHLASYTKRLTFRVFLVYRTSCIPYFKKSTTFWDPLTFIYLTQIRTLDSRLWGSVEWFAIAIRFQYMLFSKVLIRFPLKNMTCHPLIQSTIHRSVLIWIVQPKYKCLKGLLTFLNVFTLYKPVAHT